MEISDSAIKMNITNLEYGASELAKLAKKIKNKKNRRTTEAEQNEFAALIVEASFFLNSFGAASGAFGSAFQDVQGEGPKGSPIYYLKEEFLKLYEMEIKGKGEENGNGN